MGIRYSYTDYTTRGHGVIETSFSREDREDPYTESAKTPKGFKLQKVVTHIDQVSEHIRNMNPDYKREFSNRLKKGQGILISKTAYIKYLKPDKLEIYRKIKTKNAPPVRAKKLPVTQKTKREKQLEEAYAKLKKINERANNKRLAR